VAGSQEFTAIAKLYELDQSGEFDVLVLDTPPARNALDFLDAPGRLTRFFQGRAIRMFLRPAGILGRGTGLVFSVLRRVTGVDLLRDLSSFFRSLGGMIDGFTERARRVGALLEDPATTFLIVSAPRHDPVEEAIFFHRKLRDAGMPFGGLVVNRVHQPPSDALPEAVASGLGPALAERVSVATAELIALAARDAANVQRLREALDDPPTVVVPELEGDVHDVEGLALVRSHLFE
jgi:anion-transporting  ArsA/GET3 family ATPase